MNPTLVEQRAGACEFAPSFEENAKINLEDLLFSLSAEGKAADASPEEGYKYIPGARAVLVKDGKWDIVSGSIEGSRPNIFFRCSDIHALYSAWAFPIDSDMTEADIIGSSIIKPNADNTGWLFHHDHPATHHDHYISVQTALASIFQPYVNGATIKRFEATNNVARREALKKYQAISEYCEDVVEMALATEKAHHLGYFAQNPQTDEGHLHKACKLAVSAVKVEWAKTTAQQEKYRLISAEVAEIITALATPHTPETRWAKAARIEAEKKAAAEKAAAEAEAAGDGTGNGDGA